MQRYGSSYSTIELLYDSGMRDFDALARVPTHRVTDQVLNDLLDRYYPSFSTIKLLFDANMESYRKLQD